MAQFIYIDETGSVGRGANRQPLLTSVAVIVDEEKVQPIAKALREAAFAHLGWLPADFEFHGYEVWNGVGHWADKTPTELIAAYEQAIAVLDTFEIDIAYASIHKGRLRARYGGSADGNAYLLALQFLLEKIDAYGTSFKVLVADEAKEHQLRAIKMVADLQDWGGGEVPGRQLTTIIDSLHFVSSHASPGVQLADLSAFALQRHENALDSHPNARAAIERIASVVRGRARRWRQTWPPAK